ncbi:hypothetical protein HDU89_002204 [Geranomyces variabilis]|nr:hypothetical protein HDU89_002204 [Geranomyces variabilis]
MHNPTHYYNRTLLLVARTLTSTASSRPATTWPASCRNLGTWALNEPCFDHHAAAAVAATAAGSAFARAPPARSIFDGVQLTVSRTPSAGAATAGAQPNRSAERPHEHMERGTTPRKGSDGRH